MSQATISSAPYLNSNLFSNYYLDERVFDLDEWDCNEEAQEAMEEIQVLYEQEGEFLPDLNEDPLLDAWIDEVLDILGFDSIPEATLPEGGGYVDRTLFGSPDDRLEANKSKQEGDAEGLFNRSLAVLEAKQWGHDFEAMFSEQRQYRNASHQIKHYLERTPSGVSWGVLTDGKKWRLYGTKDYEPQTYYEVDLPELLADGDVEAFKRFYVFFRAEAFRESAGTTFLDKVWSESESAAQELGEDLQDNVFTALRVLGEGFVETNDLDIDPGDEKELSELKEQSLVLLYRLMFILYAESRDLIHPETPSARTEYEENFSLETLREEVKQTIDAGGSFEADFSEHSTKYWGQLEDLFGLIDTGEEDLGIPPYNGGLFDPEKHRFLIENEVSNRHIAEVLYLISTTESETSDEVVFADYADLDTRHLGGIYEGLLEHHFRIADQKLAAVADNGGQEWKPADQVTVADAVETVEWGELYVVNDDGERKATGAYYTPDYIVTYIVEETVDPLLDEIRSDLNEEGLESGDPKFYTEFHKRVLDLKILDPAMGSGHFLTKATEYLAEAIMAEARELAAGGNINGQQVRREVSKECIYGVDLNEMAVELAKLSMWLETLAADQPLAFLDHHLKAGNSLVGSDIETIEGLESDASADDSDQSSLAEFGATREGTIERLMDIYQEFLALENENLDDVKEMERKYHEIEEDELRQRLVAMANVRAAQDFGVSVPSGAYERMAKALEDDVAWREVEEKDWFQSGQRLANSHSFFHWKLEFPEVFYTIDGEPLEEDGFDGVVGNPPYVSNWELTEANSSLVEYIEEAYPDVATGHWDLYIPFCFRAITLTKSNGKNSFITPNSLATEKYGRGLRNYLVEYMGIDQLVSFQQSRVFEDVDRQYIIYLITPDSDRSQTEIVEYEFPNFNVTSTIEQHIFSEYSNTSFRFDISSKDLELKDKIEAQSTHLGNLCLVNPGVVAHSASDSELDFKKADVISNKEKPGWKKYISGSEIDRHRIDWEGRYMDYDSKRKHFHRPKFPELFESPKLMFSGVSGANNQILSVYDDEEYYSNHNINHATLWTSDIMEYKSPSDYDVLENIEEYNLKYASSVVNSKLCNYYFSKFLATGTLQGTYTSMYPEQIRQLPVHETPPGSADSTPAQVINELINRFELEQVEQEYIEMKDEDIARTLSKLTEQIREYNDQRVNVNLHLLDYLGNYSGGHTLGDLSSNPPSGIAESILTETQESRDNLRVGSVKVEKEGDSVIIHLSARYKPENEEGYETDQWGYTETALEPAIELHNLDKDYIDLVDAFVPVAVEEAGGFAGFRESATKTNSLIDRLKALTLPELNSVRSGLEDFRDAMERAEVLEEKIQRTDDLIDEIVYELYGLTDEEIAIVEEAVGG